MMTRDLLRGREYKPWIPNGRSKMVVDVIEPAVETLLRNVPLCLLPML